MDLQYCSDAWDFKKKVDSGETPIDPPFVPDEPDAPIDIPDEPIDEPVDPSEPGDIDIPTEPIEPPIVVTPPAAEKPLIEIYLWWDGTYNKFGWKKLTLELRNNGKKVDAMSCYSGTFSRQKENFIHPSKDYAGSGRPVHEGVFAIGEISIGGKNSPGVGDIWIPFEVFSKYRSNNRGAFGFHDDDNRETSRGSLGCVVFETLGDLHYVMRWLRMTNKPSQLVVDWKTGFLAEKGYKPGGGSVPPTPTFQPSRISEDGVSLITHFEGCHKKRSDGKIEAYLDPVNIPTIGWGTTSNVKMGMVVTRDEALQLFKRDLAEFELGVRRALKIKVTQAQFDALVSFAYNLGLGALGDSSLLRKLNSGDFASAARWFDAYVNAGGRKLPGLVRRRKSERHLFETGKLNFFV